MNESTLKTECSKSRNPYAYTEAEIIEVISETSNIKTFRFKPKTEIPFRAGQFMDDRAGDRSRSRSRLVQSL